MSHLSQERDANDEDGTDEVLQEDDGRAGACRSCQAHQHYNKKVYYWLRNGEKTITPEDQQFIEDVCRQHGYNGPFVYDSEHQEWVW